MGKTLIAFLMIVSPSSFAVANSVFDKVTADQPVCYGREYSSTTLKSRSKQTVQKIQAKFSHDPQYNQNIMTVEITLTEKKNFFKNYRSLLFCDKDDRCAVECDGGSVNVSLQPDGRLLVKNNGFAIQGGCSGEEGDEGTILQPTRGGDDQFKLVRLPSAFCQKSPDYLRE